jgi:uncharacterized membrane protein YraQ (UPF0718 family)
MLDELWQEFKTVLKWLLFGLLEALFISVWVIIQWAVDKHVIATYEVEGISKVVLTIAQSLFAFITLLPILLHIIESSVRMIKRTWRNLNE